MVRAEVSYVCHYTERGENALKAGNTYPKISVPRQPKRCEKCIWGHWNGVTQFCPKPVCIKKMEIGMKQEQVPLVNVQ